MKTWGDHLRKKRLDLKLLQREVAEKLGVDEATIHNWEKNYTSPSLRQTPKIIEFLGYVPFDVSKRDIGEKISSSRRLLGLSQKAMARHLGIDPSTLARWERGERKPAQKFLDRLDRFFTSLSSGVLRNEE